MMKNNKENILIVDLDGTLLKTDLLFESFWSAVKSNWKILFGLLFIIRQGKAAIKEYLQLNSTIDTTVLPFDGKVIAYINEFRAKGGRTVLATGSNYVFAERISDHLELFDEVYGSDSNTNLVGHAKASFLNFQFGSDTFEYMANSATDLAVWKISKKNITVNVSKRVRNAVDNLGVPCEHLVTNKNSIIPYIFLIRPHQWLKNILIFLPMLTAQQLNVSTALNCFLAFVSISLAASSTYVFNDLFDTNVDRQHPRKRFRPLASASVPVTHAVYLCVILLIASIIFAMVLGSKFLIILAIYYTFSTMYSIYIKSKIILDICCLAGLYTLRLVLGGAAAHVTISIWLLTFSIFLFLCLAAVKRQSELLDLKKRGLDTPLGRGYHVEDIQIISTSALCAGYASVVVMMLYLNSPQVLDVFTYPTPLWCICAILLYWITRLVLVTQRGFMTDDPIVFAIKDRASQGCFLVISSCLIISVWY